MSEQISGLVLVPAATPPASIGPWLGVPAATLQTWLTAAQTALHSIILTGQPTTVTYGIGDGQKSVTYSRTTEFALRNHIRELLFATGQGPGRRPLRFVF